MAAASVSRETSNGDSGPGLTVAFIDTYRTKVSAGVMHPLVDFSGSGWVATQTRAPVVWLSQARTNLLVQAAKQGTRVAIVSGQG